MAATIIKKLRTTARGRVFVVLLLCGLAGIGAAFLYFSGEGGAGIPCPTYSLLGFYCAGCGASRALRSILHLQFYQAFRYNPLLVVLLPFIAAYFGALAVSYVRTGENHVDAKLPFRWLYVLAIVVILYSVVRNFPFFPFNWLQPTVVA